MKKIIIFLVIMSFCNESKTQTIEQRMNHLVHKMISTDYRPFSLINDIQLGNSPDSLISLLKKYETFPNSNVQNCVYESYYELIQRNTDTIFRRQMINKLLKACAYTDSAKLSYACIQSTEYLASIDNKYFTNEMIDTINRRSMLKNKYYIYYAWLSGKLYQTKMIPFLEQKTSNSGDISEKQKLDVILARLGNTKKIHSIRDFLKSMTIENRLRQEKIFLYVRQKQIVNILIDDVLSDEKGTPYFEQWMSVPSETICAFDALKLVTKLIHDFPIPTKDSYTTADLVIARAWIKIHRNNYTVIK